MIYILQYSCNFSIVLAQMFILTVAGATVVNKTFVIHPVYKVIKQDEVTFELILVVGSVLDMSM